MTTINMRLDQAATATVYMRPLLAAAVILWLRISVADADDAAMGVQPPIRLPGYRMTRCGHVNVPFPFGLEPGCHHLWPSFNLTCTAVVGGSNDNTPILWLLLSAANGEYAGVTNANIYHGTDDVPWGQYTGLICLSEEERRASNVVQWLPNAGNATCPADLVGTRRWLLNAGNAMCPADLLGTRSCHINPSTCHAINLKIGSTPNNAYLCQCDDGFQGNTYLSEGCHGTTDLPDAGVMQSHPYAIAAALVSAYMVWFWVLTRRLSGPWMWPLVGSLPSVVLNRGRVHDWIADNLRSMGESATYQTCILPLPFLARRQGLVTVTCNPRNLEHILRARFDNYPKGPEWQAAFHDLLGHGIFNSDGETWLMQRKTAALEFTTRTLRQAMARWANRIIKYRLWSILADHSGEAAASVDLQDLLLRFTFDNICGLTFGKDPETLSPGLQENPFANAFDSATEAMLQRLLFPSFLWRIKKALGVGSERSLRESLTVVDQYMTEAIAARKATPSDDLLSRFMKKKTSSDDNVLQWIALNFVLAGRDTSSVALSWFFWIIMQRRDVERKVVLEMAIVLRETRGDNGSGTGRSWTEEPLDFNELDRLVYLKAALAETLRLYPSVPLDSKYAVDDDVLPDGTMVPAGSAITYSIYSVGRMESIWAKDCAEFRPERWLSEDGTRFEPTKDAYRFVAFNAGPRTCLGKDLAYLQMKSIASAVLLRHSVELVPGHKVEQKMSLTLFMNNGLHVHVKPRDLAAYIAEASEEVLEKTSI